MARTDRPRLSASSTTRHPVLPEAPDTASFVIPSDRICAPVNRQEETPDRAESARHPQPHEQDQLRQFFAHISRDPSLREQVLQAVSADAAALIAQELGYEVSGDELLRFSGKSSSGVSVTKIQHPGEYH